jgi:hypothetical protein
MDAHLDSRPSYRVGNGGHPSGLLDGLSGVA